MSKDDSKLVKHCREALSDILLRRCAMVQTKRRGCLSARTSKDDKRELRAAERSFLDAICAAIDEDASVNAVPAFYDERVEEQNQHVNPYRSDRYYPEKETGYRRPFQKNPRDHDMTNDGGAW